MTAPYTLVGGAWPTNAPVTYAFTSAISDPGQQAAIVSAFDTWASVTGLNFQHAAPGVAADITIGFANNQQFGTLGETYLTYSNGAIQPGVTINLENPGEMPLNNIDGALTYMRPGYATYNDTTLNQLALHEIGHAIGFGVSADSESIESLFLSSINRGLDLTDYQGAQFLYPQTAAATPAAVTSAASSDPSLPHQAAAVVLPTLQVNGLTITATPGNGYTESYTGAGGIVVAGSDNAYIKATSGPSAVTLKGGSNYVSTTGASLIDAGIGTAQISMQTGGTSVWDAITHLQSGDLIALWMPGASNVIPTWGGVQGIGALAGETLEAGGSAITLSGIGSLAGLQAGFGTIGGESVVLVGKM